MPSSRSTPQLAAATERSLAERATGPANLADWQNLLEPASLVHTYLKEPPLGFEPVALGRIDAPVPAFVTDFDALTTLDAPLRKWIGSIPFVHRSLNLRTLFIGTTITEYCVFPAAQSAEQLLTQMRQALRANGASAIIVKDLPFDSPLLNQEMNRSANRWAEALEGQGFLGVAGQALAYVPLDFSTTDELLMRMSRTRRKSIRRKLRIANTLEINRHPSGDPWFLQAGVTERLYRLYLNVVEKSEYQFDVLSEQFFREILLRAEHSGIVFTYQRGGEIIGFNLCFVHDNKLIDKYVGFEYPAARQHNLYYISWFQSLEYALENRFDTFIAGSASPEIKAFLGAQFTPTRHLIYLANPVLRWLLGRFRRHFEMDAAWLATYANNSVHQT